jgi:sensor histidine kinase YesM
MYRTLSLFFLFIITVSHAAAQSIATVRFSEDDGLPCSNVIDLSLYKDELVLLCNMGENYTYNGVEFDKFHAADYSFGSVSGLSEHAFFTSSYSMPRYNTTDTSVMVPDRTEVHRNNLYYGEFPHIYRFDTARLQWNKIFDILHHYPFLKNDSAEIEIVNEYTFAINSKQKYIINIRNHSMDTMATENRILLWENSSNQAYTTLNHKFLHVTHQGQQSKYALKSNTDPLSILDKNKDEGWIEFITYEDDTATFYRLQLNDPQLETIAKVLKGDEFWTVPIPYDRYYSCSNASFELLNPNILEFQLSDENFPPSLFSMGYINNTLILGGYGSGLRYVKNGKIKYFDSVDPPISNNILTGNINYQGKSLFFVEGQPQVIAIDSSLSINQYQILYNNQTTDNTGYYFDTLRNGRLGVGLEELGLGLVDSFSNGYMHCTVYGEELGFDLDNVLCFEEDQKGQIWMGHYKHGIAILNQNRDTILNFKYQAQDQHSFGVLSMEMDRRENLWLGTTKGLYLLEAPHSFDIYADDLFKKAKKITLPNNTNSLVSSMKEMNGHLVLGDHEAISFIPLNFYYRDQDSTPIYQYRYGVDIPGRTTEQNCIVQEDERYFWICTAGNALRFDFQNLIKDTTQSDVVIQTIICNDDTIFMDKNSISVPAGKRNISIDIGLDQNPSLLNNVFYDYTLLNNNEDTILHKLNINNPFIEIPHISPGNYQLQIKAKKHGLEMDTLSAKVHVQKHLSESIWFWVLMVLGVSLLIIWLLWNRITLSKEVLAKEQLKNKLDKEQLQNKLAQERLESSLNKTRIESIISSFNPHFIHNSLHWIQSRYNEDDRLTELIAKLSENIRFIYNNTAKGQPIHSLEEELKLVDNYVNIQLLRFGNRFKYFPPEEAMVENYAYKNIPLMQLQIHVENAIEHGIKHQRNKDETFVKITMEEEGEYLIFKVIDNGIGREKASKMPSGGSNSGVKMMNEMHRILNAQNENKITQEYHDNFYKTHGTCVLIKIPKSLTYEI